MSDADSLARGTIELNLRRTDLEPMLRRIVEESGVDVDHEVIVEAERVVVTHRPGSHGADPLGIAASLRQTAPRRTRSITVRLTPHEGGALLSVEDPEPSSDASLSPVVERFAEVQGGWATVESREEGGSAFRVFLPDGANAPEASAPTDVESSESEAADEDAGATEPEAQVAVPAGSDDDLHIVVETGQERAGGDMDPVPRAAPRAGVAPAVGDHGRGLMRAGPPPRGAAGSGRRPDLRRRRSRRRLARPSAAASRARGSARSALRSLRSDAPARRLLR